MNTAIDDFKIILRIAELLIEIETAFEIEIHHRNRTYREKMKTDVTEMYYYLRHLISDRTSGL